MQKKREVKLHNEVESEMALEMGVYDHRYKRTENVKMRYTAFYPALSVEVPFCKS